MKRHTQLDKKELLLEIRASRLLFAGNYRLKIYGKLGCALGKRMKKQNRVFFISEMEAIHMGFRPCGHCMHEEYKKWRNGVIQ